MEPPDTALTAPCDQPEDHLRSGDWKVIAGGLGVALIQCGEKQAALADWAGDVVEAFGK